MPRSLKTRCAIVAFVLGSSIGPGATASAQAGGRTHVVRPGDTLTRIARRHHVSVDTLRRANRIRGEIVRPGERLRIPRASGSRRWRHRTGARRHVVRAGDTLARVARRYRSSVAEVRAANGLRGDSIHPGQTLLVPRRGQTGAAIRARSRVGNPVTETPPPIADTVREPAEALAAELGIGPTHVGQRILRDGPEPRWIEAAGEPDSVVGTLLMPVSEHGHFMRGWGSGRGGYHLAVDIGAPTGTEVQASERGLVVYAGSGMRGYGNIVLIVHANGWVTAYAHNRVNLVVAGQIVERGAPIGRVGQTGFARGPHVHFILSMNGEHCDPVPLFTPRIQRRDGTEVDSPVVVWDTAHRPSAVLCLPRSARPHPHYGERRGRRRR